MEYGVRIKYCNYMFLKYFIYYGIAILPPPARD